VEQGGKGGYEERVKGRRGKRSEGDGREGKGWTLAP